MAAQYGNVNPSNSYGERVYLDVTTSSTEETYTLSVKAGIQAYTKAISISTSSLLYDNVRIHLDCNPNTTGSIGLYVSSGAYTLAKSSARQHISKSFPIQKTHETQTVTLAGWSNIAWLDYVTEAPWWEGAGTAAALSATTENSSLKTITYTIPPKTNYVISFNANGGTGTAPDNITKWHNESITLPSNTFTRAGYDFKGWGTTSSGGTVYDENSEYKGNATIELYAIWESNYVAPIISNMVAFRSTSSGEESDDDVYARVKFNYTEPMRDYTTYSSYTIQVRYKQQSENEYTTQTVTGTNGIVDTILPNIAAEYAYDIMAVISPTGYTDVSRLTYVSEAYYIIDINSDGTGIAFGQASNEEGFLCNMDAYFKDKADVMRPLFDFFYPVGSYYETSLPSTVNGHSYDNNNLTDTDIALCGSTWFDPRVVWGGTWAKDSAGRVTVAQDTSETKFDVIGETGGATTSATGNHTLTAAQSGIRAHGHGMTHTHGTNNSDYDRYVLHDSSNTSGILRRAIKNGTGTEYTGMVYSSTAFSRGGSTGASSKSTVDNNAASDATQAHNHGSVSTLQPYIVVNRWHRTA